MREVMRLETPEQVGASLAARLYPLLQPVLSEVFRHATDAAPFLRDLRLEVVAWAEEHWNGQPQRLYDLPPCVYPCRGRFIAVVKVKGKPLRLGNCPTPEEAQALVAAYRLEHPRQRQRCD